MRSGAAALAVLAVAAFAPGAALAQLGSGGGTLVVEADTLDVFNEDGMVVYEGRVDAAQNDTQIRADRLELYFAQSASGAADIAGGGMGDLERAIAIGSVYYVTPDQVASGQRAVYEAATDTVTFTGNVTVKQGCDVLSGDTIVMNLTTRDAQVRSNNPAQRQDRVRTVIFSEDESASQGDCAP